MADRPTAPKRESSPELSSLAAKVLQIPQANLGEMEGQLGVDAYNSLLGMAKRLAGSVLSQDETPAAARDEGDRL